MAGLNISLGKEPPKPKEKEPDAYDALARSLLRALEAKDAGALATALRDTGMFGSSHMEEEDEEY